MNSEAFVFVDAGWKPSPGAYVAEVPSGLTTTDALLHVLYDCLGLPGYFGFNWDALDECLCDLGWLQQRAVVLRHAEVPSLPATDLRIYLEVLADAVSSWQPGKEHTFHVAFPAAARAEVMRSIAGPRGRRSR